MGMLQVARSFTAVPKIILFCFLATFVPDVCDAQCSNGVATCNQVVPHVVKFDGVLKELEMISRPHTVSIRFVIYGDSEGPTPLWQEVQNVQVDQQGRYEVMLGANTDGGIPVNLFPSGESRWLGVQALLPGHEEQPRVLLVSVPYAIQAENAQTLGGLPASAFARATPATASATITNPVTEVGNEVGVTESDPQLAPKGNPRSPTVPDNSSPFRTLDEIPKFASGPSLVNSQIRDQGGMVTVQNLANVLFADRFTNGVPDAVQACPSQGCVIYAGSPNVNLNLGTIDPGSKGITIYLGPFTYTVKQITLRSSLKIIGMGSATTLQSINGNNPVFVLPQGNFAAATNVNLSDFSLAGSAGNTSEDGFFLDTSSGFASGLWYSTIHDIFITGFAGNSIHVRGPNNSFNALTQWVLFDNVVVFRTRGGGNALRLEGAVFELRFVNCEFDGQGVGDGTNIYLGGLPGGTGGYPLSIVFEGLVSQEAGLAVQIDGGLNLTFHKSHHESLWAAYQVNDTHNIWTLGLTISECLFWATGVNNGAGFILNVNTTQAQINFSHNYIFGVVDSVVNSTNLASVSYQDNGFFAATLPPTSNVTSYLAPVPSINIQGVHSVGLSQSTTPITTIQSSLGPGETVTFFAFSGPVIFAAGGNIDLMGMNSLTVTGTITFVRTDFNGLLWKPVSQWSPTATAAPTAAASR